MILVVDYKSDFSFQFKLKMIILILKLIHIKVSAIQQNKKKIIFKLMLVLFNIFSPFIAIVIATSLAVWKVLV